LVQGSFLGVRAWPEGDADHSPPSSAKVNNEKKLYFLSHLTPAWRSGIVFITIMIMVVIVVVIILTITHGYPKIN
jgi:hypothetical protein